MIFAICFRWHFGGCKVRPKVEHISKCNPKESRNHTKKRLNRCCSTSQNIMYLPYRTHIGTLWARSADALFLSCFLDAYFLQFFATVADLAPKLDPTMGVPFFPRTSQNGHRSQQNAPGAPQGSKKHPNGAQGNQNGALRHQKLKFGEHKCHRKGARVLSFVKLAVRSYATLFLANGTACCSRPAVNMHLQLV